MRSRMKSRLDGMGVAALIATLICAAPALAVIGFALAPSRESVSFGGDLLRDGAFGTLALTLVGGGGALCSWRGRRLAGEPVPISWARLVRIPAGAAAGRAVLRTRLCVFQLLLGGRGKPHPDYWILGRRFRLCGGALPLCLSIGARGVHQPIGVRVSRRRAALARARGRCSGASRCRWRGQVWRRARRSL